jgi:hypothetical protein
MNCNQLLIASALSAVLLSTAGGEAQTTAYPAIACRPLQGVQNFQRGWEAGHISGKKWSGAPTAEVYCPVVKQEATDVDAGTVTVQGTGISCSLYGTNPSGTTVTVVQGTPVTTSTSTQQTVNLDPIDAATPYVFLICSLPSTPSTISQYTITEGT